MTQFQKMVALIWITVIQISMQFGGLSFFLCLRLSLTTILIFPSPIITMLT